MADLWYYAEGGQQRGPIALSELIPILARIADPRRVMVWQHDFEHRKPVEEVRELAEQLARSLPDPAPPPVESQPSPQKMLSPSRMCSPR